MAYLERIETDHAQPLADAALAPSPDSGFSRLEWSVIRLARKDGLSTLRAPGRLRRFWNWWMAQENSPELVNPHLEALRRMAVLTWRFGFAVPAEEVVRFLSAGFSPSQYELMVTGIRSNSSAS